MPARIEQHGAMQTESPKRHRHSWNPRLGAIFFSGVIASCAGVPLPKEGLNDPGALLYNGYVRPEVNCYICHNGDGKGARGPSLVRKVPQMPEEKIVGFMKGSKGFMPKYASKMSEEEMVQVAQWLKATFP
jgi:mono/diheme cytochrome c family protein